MWEINGQWLDFDMIYVFVYIREGSILYFKIIEKPEKSYGLSAKNSGED